MSFSGVPPNEMMHGLRVVAIFSSSSQSFESALAILMIGRLNSTHQSTDFSSKGVAMGMQPDFLMVSTITP